MRMLTSSLLRFSGAHRRIFTAAGFGIALIAALSLGAVRWAHGHADALSDVSAAQMARIHAGLLGSELQKFRLLPLVLIEYPDVHSVLERDDPASARRLNSKLELLASRTDAAVIYVLRQDGRTIASSNWRRPDSFVGHDYRFRAYFREALQRGAAEMFALGAVSGRPGLFIARRIEGGSGGLGVIVVKVEFDRLETTWARQAGPTFVTDRNGAVLITSRPEWRFRVARTLSAQAPNRALATGEAARPLDLSFRGKAVAQSSPDGLIRYRLASLPVPLAGGRLNVLQPLAPAMASALTSARLAILAAIILVAGVLGLMLRVREKALLQADARRTLETQVALRTTELTDVNRRLIAESREREQADRSLRAARDELAQANRLGSIGQITAGVAHEINQPVAAIRTFAENAGQFLDRGRPERAQANLDVIVDLTRRIGTITAELRAFARQASPRLGAVELVAAIDGALLLLGDRIRSAGVTLDRIVPDPPTRVTADRVRLEQILINLLQNAIEALEGCDEPRLRIAVSLAGEDRALVEVTDSGPGVPPELADQIFTPFVTGRPNGLGLGLGIARDIARECGGELDLVPSDLGGAGFRLSLRCA